MKKRQTPRLMRSALLDRVYIVTSYDDLGEGRFLAKEKYDVTEEFEAIAAQRGVKAVV